MRRVVPRCGLVSMARRPLTRRTRSSRLIRPRPSWRRAAAARSNPRPSSRMVSATSALGVASTVTCARAGSPRAWRRSERLLRHPVEAEHDVGRHALELVVRPERSPSGHAPRSNSRQWLRRARRPARRAAARPGGARARGGGSPPRASTARVLQPSDLAPQAGRRSPCGRRPPSALRAIDSAASSWFDAVVKLSARGGGAPPPGRSSAARPGRRMCAALSCAACSARCRTSAWPKTSASSRSRPTSSSDHCRASRTVPITRVRTMTAPPARMGMTAVGPRADGTSALTVDRSLSGRWPAGGTLDDVTLAELGGELRAPRSPG